MTDLVNDSMIDYLINWLTDRLNDLLSDWLVDCVTEWLINWWDDWLTKWLSKWMTDWRFCDILTGRLTDWLQQYKTLFHFLKTVIIRNRNLLWHFLCIYKSILLVYRKKKSNTFFIFEFYLIFKIQIFPINTSQPFNHLKRFLKMIIKYKSIFYQINLTTNIQNFESMVKFCSRIDCFNFFLAWLKKTIKDTSITKLKKKIQST